MRRLLCGRQESGEASGEASGEGPGQGRRIKTPDQASRFQGVPPNKAGTLRRGPFSIPSAGKNTAVLTRKWASLWTQYDPKTSGKEAGPGLSVGNRRKKRPL